MDAQRVVATVTCHSDLPRCIRNDEVKIHLEFALTISTEGGAERRAANCAKLV